MFIGGVSEGLQSVECCFKRYSNGDSILWRHGLQCYEVLQQAGRLPRRHSPCATFREVAKFRDKCIRTCLENAALKKEAGLAKKEQQQTLQCHLDTARKYAFEFQLPVPF